jgi:rhodanese-related sulfurtransferase
MNINGYESLDTVLEKASKPLTPQEFEVIANETDALVLDTRDASAFAKGFIPNSINIGLNGNFAMWVGEMVLDIKQKILLVTEIGKEEESMIRLSRIGYDHTIGYLAGGIESWKKEDLEIDSLDRISAQELERMDDFENALIVDVRKKSEFNSEHLIAATNIPLNELNSHLSELPKDKKIILHCAGGYRSMIAASMLKQRGWDNLTDVLGGFVDIKTTKLATTEFICPTTLL